MSICPVRHAADLGYTIFASAGCFIYNFQTLIAGVSAIDAAIYAGAPVWRQLKDSNLQTRILHRETLASLLRESQERYSRVSRDIEPALMDLDQLTTDPIGEPIEIDEHDAHGMEQRIYGALNWYLVVLKGTETEQIEAAKEALSASLDDLTSTLNDVHWTAHNEQHDEDHSISNEDWAELLQRADKAKLLAAEKTRVARVALRILQTTQGDWIKTLRSQISKLDLSIADS